MFPLPFELLSPPPDGDGGVHARHSVDIRRTMGCLRCNCGIGCACAVAEAVACFSMELSRCSNCGRGLAGNEDGASVVGL